MPFDVEYEKLVKHCPHCGSKNLCGMAFGRNRWGCDACGALFCLSSIDIHPDLKKEENEKANHL